MKTKLVLIAIIMTMGIANAQQKLFPIKIFFDDFNGDKVSSSRWHIPYWDPSTYFGRTQVRCAETASLPLASNSQAIINLETYCDPTGRAFYGTDLITNRTFFPGDSGLVVNISFRIKTPAPGGFVGAAFFYEVIPPGIYHNEIDIEAITNLINQIQTNLYMKELLGAGHPEFAPLSRPITESHMYTIKWSPYEVSIIVDGKLIRKSKTLVPKEPMHFHINIWAPEKEWAEAYNVNLQPTNSKDLNKIYSLLVDSVRIDSLVTSLPTSVRKSEEDKIGFYPNPSHDMIHFNSWEDISVSIYNISGNAIIERKKITDGSLSVANLLPGLYIVRSEKNGITKNYKLIVR